MFFCLDKNQVQHLLSKNEPAPKTPNPKWTKFIYNYSPPKVKCTKFMRNPHKNMEIIWPHFIYIIFFWYGGGTFLHIYSSYIHLISMEFRQKQQKLLSLKHCTKLQNY